MAFELEPDTTLAELNSHTNVNLVMMFTAATAAEQQMRLRNGRFREFVTNILDCKLLHETVTVQLGRGLTASVEQHRPDNESCSRFIMETNLERLRERSASIASLLKSETVLDNVPNHNVDKSFRVFYAMPLCLVFFFGWARIIKWYSHLKLQAQRRMGATKKMIKVTKSLVEKQGIFLQRRMPGMEELELADFARLKRPIGMNSGILLRCRLKGSYLRTHPQGFADGHGHAFSTASTFVFECEGQAGPLQQGVPCSIRNFEGHALVVDRYGTRFLIDENEHATGPDFVVEPLDKGATGCFFGDTIRIKCLSTGMYLRISKDGDVDGAGQSSMAEVQLVVDVGGAPIESGAIVTLRGGAVLDCLHADPSGEVRIGGGSAQPPGYSAKDWTYWLIERQSEQCRSAPSDARSDGGLAAGRGTSHNTLSSEACAEPLQDGDIVSLKGLNQRFLEADVATGICRCTAGRGQNAAEAQLFVVHRLGVNRISKHNSAIRTGAEVCLKPVSRGDSAKSYLRSFGGRMSADGAVCDEGICLTIDVSSVQHVVEALSQALAEGDVAINCSPVWDKQEVRLVEGMSAAWTTAETLSTFRGAVVFARDDASYALPKGNAEWVGVVPDGVDLVKACQQAHSQGATGLVVRCDEPCCLERLAAFSDGDDAPVLPVVWVSQAVADAFQERGLVLNHCSVRRQHITDVMRAIGRFGGKQTKDAHAHAEIFTTVGAAMLLQHEDLCAQQRAQDAQQHEFDAQRQAVDESRRAEEPPPEKTYKWKITGNTDYLWAGTTYRGLPRAAAVPVKYNEPPPARTRLSVVHSDAREVRELRLGQELAEMMTQEQAEAAAQRHELSEERDFRVEYKFEEIECGIDETPADLDAAEFMVDQGAVVQAIGVPKDMFWMVICGLVAFTLLLAILLLVIFNGMKEPDMEGSPPPVGFEAAAASAARSAFATFVPGHLRHSHDSGLAASLVSENFLAHAQARRLFLSQRQ
uniref:Uncharacterized protein n=1 Tax=Zooxanthella nutricula TaxID=1333877 RepID=A0A7S2QM65_9DINO|mmetsp:Transcript_96296/g.294528  ORF Transcript_96296/g.294528 Transcript_96296/m.294528 type:complete len:982 (+) Transcript_96296:1168-4113(+)